MKVGRCEGGMLSTKEGWWVMVMVMVEFGGSWIGNFILVRIIAHRRCTVGWGGKWGGCS